MSNNKLDSLLERTFPLILSTCIYILKLVAASLTFTLCHALSRASLSPQFLFHIRERCRANIALSHSLSLSPPPLSLTRVLHAHSSAQPISIPDANISTTPPLHRLAATRMNSAYIIIFNYTRIKFIESRYGVRLVERPKAITIYRFIRNDARAVARETAAREILSAI